MTQSDAAGRAGSTADTPRKTFLGVPIERRTTIGSTNDELLRRASEGAPEGLVMTADEQTAGRGRQGRLWWDRPGESLLFSVLLRPTLPLPRLPLLGIAMACAVAEVGGEVAGVPLSVKWPNDVLHVGRKLCGVLAEARPVAGGSSYLVLGTGINVNQDREAFPEEIRERATSLRLAAGGRRIDREPLFGAVLDALDRYRVLAAREGAAALHAAVRPWLPKAGEAVTVKTAERTIVGVVEDVLETGALLLREESGARMAVAAGEIPFDLGTPA